MLIDSRHGARDGDAARHPHRLRVAPQRPRPARLEPPLADGAAARPRRRAARLPVGRRPGRPAAARRRRAARAARVRQPRRRRDRVRPPARAPARAGRARPAHRPAQPPRLRAGARGPRAAPLALVICDLDHFKRVNDTLGHPAGDDVLRTFSDLLRACTREDDVAVRLGGEEFALVLSGVGEREALAVAERLRREVASTFRDFPVPISVSVGIADGARDQDAEALVRAANRALFAAKRLGRDRCVVHHAETLAMLDALADDRAGEQLAAAMLLAETLDLRDVATARHSRDRRPLRRADRPRAGPAARPGRARARRRRAARHRQARHLRRGAAQARRARARTSGRRSCATPSSAPASSSTPTCATSRAGSSPTTSASTAPATRARSPASRSRSRAASSRSPTPTRR